MQHSFNVEFAIKYGVTEAILISHLEYWIKKNEANNKNFFDGRYWTYNSIKAWSELFPYLSEKKIRNALKHLENEGLILTGNYNTSAYDRTRWYSFSDMATSILLKWKMEVEKEANQNSKNGEPIPDIIPNTIPDDNPPISPQRGESSAAFERFWQAYPRKVGKQAALKAFKKVKVSVEILVEAVEKQKRSSRWRKDNGQYIPNPATWLNQGRWEDEVEQTEEGGPDYSKYF